MLQAEYSKAHLDCRSPTSNSEQVVPALCGTHLNGPVSSNYQLQGMSSTFAAKDMTGSSAKTSDYAYTYAYHPGNVGLRTQANSVEGYKHYQIGTPMMTSSSLPSFVNNNTDHVYSCAATQPRANGSMSYNTQGSGVSYGAADVPANVYSALIKGNPSTYDNSATQYMLESSSRPSPTTGLNLGYPTPEDGGLRNDGVDSRVKRMMAQSGALPSGSFPTALPSGMMYNYLATCGSQGNLNRSTSYIPYDSTGRATMNGVAQVYAGNTPCKSPNPMQEFHPQSYSPGCAPPAASFQYSALQHPSLQPQQGTPSPYYMSQPRHPLEPGCAVRTAKPKKPFQRKGILQVLQILCSRLNLCGTIQKSFRG